MNEISENNSYRYINESEHDGYETHKMIKAYLTRMRNEEQIRDFMEEFDRRSEMSSNQCNRLVEKLTEL